MDEEKILQLANIVDVLTVEIEHVNADFLLQLETMMPNLIIHPARTHSLTYSLTYLLTYLFAVARTLLLIQDKYKQKQYLQTHHIALPEFMDVPDIATAHEGA